MLSAILKYAPLAVFALLAWLYVSLNEDVTALRQENTAIEHALKQQATLSGSDGKRIHGLEGAQ